MIQQKTQIQEDNLTAFNNPPHDLHFFNSSKFRKAIIPSLGGHGSSLSVAKFFDFLANDLKYDTNNIIKKETLDKLIQITKSNHLMMEKITEKIYILI